MIDTFVDDASRRPDILARARVLTAARAVRAGIPFADYRYRSYCRLNVHRRSGDRSP